MGEVARFTRSEVCVLDASEVHFVSEVCAEFFNSCASDDARLNAEHHDDRVITWILIIIFSFAALGEAVGFVEGDGGSILTSHLKEHRLNTLTCLGLHTVGKQAIADAALALLGVNGYAIYLALGGYLSADNVADNTALVRRHKAHAKVGADV